MYTDVHHTVKKLTDEQAGKLFKHILSYVNDENPEINDILLDLVFEPIKQSLKRDLRKYEIIREKRSKAGRASADKRQQVLTHVEPSQQVSTLSTVSDSVNGSVNVIDIKKEGKRKRGRHEFKDENVLRSVEFYIKEVDKAKQFNDPMSIAYVNICRVICKKDENGNWEMPFVLNIKKQISLESFLKLYKKSGNNAESILLKIKNIQNVIDYQLRYSDLAATMETWIDNDKKR